jgi:hypothetical protein
MNENLIAPEIIEAIDEIRRPAPNLLAGSMTAVRASGRRSKVPTFTAAIAAGIAAAVIVAFVGAASLRNAAMTRESVRPQIGLPSCTLPVRTDQGPGLLAIPSGTFRSAGLPASQATAYNPATHSWLPTQPEGVSPDGKLVAILDNKKFHNSTLQLQKSTGQVLYSRDHVMRILGWSSDGNLLVTTVDAPTRLLRISRDGTGADWVDPLSNTWTTWSFVAGQYVWGVAMPYPDPEQRRIVVRLNLATRAVDDWYAMRPDSFNDNGYGPIFGLTSDGYPIVPQTKSDARSAVFVIRAKDSPTPISVASGGEVTPSAFWPEDAVGDKHGIWVTTGELYWSSGTSELQPVKVPASLHIYSFGGSCN